MTFFIFEWNEWSKVSISMGLPASVGLEVEGSPAYGGQKPGGSGPVCCALGVGPQLPGWLGSLVCDVLGLTGLVLKHSSVHVKVFLGVFACNRADLFWEHRWNFEKWMPCLSPITRRRILGYPRSPWAHANVLFAFLSLPSGFAFLKFPVYKVMCHVLSGVGRSSLRAWFEFTHVAVCASDALIVLSSIARLDTRHMFIRSWWVTSCFWLWRLTLCNISALASCGHVRGHALLLHEC